MILLYALSVGNYQIFLVVLFDLSALLNYLSVYLIIHWCSMCFNFSVIKITVMHQSPMILQLR